MVKDINWNRPDFAFLTSNRAGKVTTAVKFFYGDRKELQQTVTGENFQIVGHYSPEDMMTYVVYSTRVPMSQQKAAALLADYVCEVYDQLCRRDENDNC